MKTVLTGIVLISLAAISSECRRSNAIDTPLPPELLVPEAAEKVHVDSKPTGQVAVRYLFHQTFPADPLVSRIRAALPRSKWTPLEEDWMNAGMPGEQPWGSFEDARRQPSELVHSWSAAWRDEPGNVVQYTLSYRSRPRPTDKWDAPPDGSELIVSAAWFPATLVRATREALGLRGPLK